MPNINSKSLEDPIINNFYKTDNRKFEYALKSV